MAALMAELVAPPVPANEKATILRHLRRMGVDYFTVYHDLDSLARELRVSWQLFPKTQE